jgi:hypothetical protein
MLGYFPAIFLLWFLLFVVSIVFGAIGLARTIKGKSKGLGWAILGFVVGLVQFLFILTLLLFI